MKLEVSQATLSSANKDLYMLRDDEKHHWDPYADVKDFHEKFQLTYEGKPRALLEELRVFRANFMKEEADEYDASSRDLEDHLSLPSTYRNPEYIAHELAEQLDAIVDLLYVALGAAFLQGFSRDIFVEAWRRVHHANMYKVRAARPEQSKRGTIFDVVKPDGWEPPCLEDLVEDNAHK